MSLTQFKDYSPEEYKDHSVAHWSKSPCGGNYTEEEILTLEYFQEVERYRYSSHPWLRDAIRGFDVRGRRVLEIGFGLGTDHAELARQGAIMHGLELTPQHLHMTKRRLDLRGLKSSLLVGDAEDLPYRSESFDFVYSFGVIHHSPDISRIIAEIHRVLKPSSRCYIGVYHRNSVFFWWTVLMVNWLLLRGFLRRSLRQQVSLIEYPGDDENLIVRLFSRKEARSIFGQFSQTRVSVRHFLPNDVAFLGRFLREPSRPRWYLDLLGERFGWYVIVEAVK